MEDADVLDLVHQEGKKNIIESNYWWLQIDEFFVGESSVRMKTN